MGLLAILKLNSFLLLLQGLVLLWTSEVMSPISSLQREKKICHKTYCVCSVKAKSVFVPGFVSLTCGTGVPILLWGGLGITEGFKGIKGEVLACCDLYLLLDGYKMAFVQKNPLEGTGCGDLSGSS